MKDRTAPKGSYPSEYMFSGQGKDVRYIATGEFRNPRKGDWFLSGAIVQAYKAFADMTSPYWIAERDEESTAFRVGEQVTKDKFTVGSSTVPYVLTITALLWTDRGLLIRADLPDGKGTIEGPAKMFTAVATNAVAATPAEIQRTDEIETLYDIIHSVTIAWEKGELRGAMGDSRERLDTCIQWSNEFNKANRKTNWTENEYLEAVDDFARAKIAAEIATMQATLLEQQKRRNETNTWRAFPGEVPVTE